MKIESIHIQHFGHFTNFGLEFGSQPFVLLFGRNEAGKTTLLEFLRQLLFGFPERTPYNFGEGGELGGSAVLQLADQRRIAFKRRKGRKNTLQAHLNGSDATLDEAGFRQLLGNANENVFKTVFAFGLDELRTGNEGLKEESLQSALFGGGLGGAFNPEVLLKELDVEARSLFKPSASIPTINALAAELRRLGSEIKQHTIRSDDYEQRERVWREAQAEADQLAIELNDLRRKHARLERLHQALPRWLALRNLRAERATLTVPPAFPHDAENQFRTANDAIRRLSREIDAVTSDSEEIRKQLESLQLDKTLLPFRAQIEDCHRLIQSVADARRDLPLRMNERERLYTEICAEVERLRPGWELENLRSFAPDAPTTHRIDELYRQRLELHEDRTRLSARRAEVFSGHEQITLDLESLEEPQDITALATVLEQAPDYTADQKTLRKERDEQAKLGRMSDSQRARLSPPVNLGAIPRSVSIEFLPIPPRDLINGFDTESRDIEQRIGSARQAIAEAENQRGQLQRELAGQNRQLHSVPRLDDLRDQRTRRDQLWQLIRGHYFENLATDQPVPDADHYEHAVVDADSTADRIYEHADEVARREHLTRQLAEVTELVRHRVEESHAIQQERSDWELRWIELWRPCGFTPLAPPLMLQWLEAFAAFADTQAAIAQGQVELDSCAARIGDFETRLRVATQSQAGDVKTILAAAKQTIRQVEEAAQQRKRMERDRRRLDKQLQGIDAEFKSWQDADTLWRTEWTSVLQSIGLPGEWTANLAMDVLGKLATAREKLTNLSVLEERIAQMEVRLKEFDPRVRSICKELKKPCDEDRPELTLDELHRRLSEATQLQERRSNLESRLEENSQRERKQRGELADWQSRRNQLLNWAGVENEGEFFAVAARVRNADRLDTQIQELCGQLAVARGNESEEVFNAELDTADRELLQAEASALETRLQTQQAAAEQAREKAGGLRCQFDELDGSNAAALLCEQMAHTQARLATDIHRYVPLVFARQLLQSAIKRFERENQPEMIRAISELFSTMTRGTYVEIERPATERTALYVRNRDGSERSPDQLSTGTREQLYLAIRLGYVLHYCKQSEPLPIVMDDVLVNFDAERALATLEALRDASKQAQILFFTCHQHVVHLVASVFPDVQPRELPARISGS